MGVMLSVFRSIHRHHLVTLEAIEPRLGTGDVVLFSGQGSNQFIARRGSRQPATQSGFLIRRDQGLDGLYLCHPGLEKGRLTCHARLTQIETLLKEFPTPLVVIRKLCAPLSVEEQEQVIRFAEENEGTAVDGRVTLLMQRPELAFLCAPIHCVNCSKRTVERFICSELVARMLMDLKLIEQSRSVYVPAAGTQKYGRRLSETTLFQTSILVTPPPP